MVKLGNNSIVSCNEGTHGGDTVGTVNMKSTKAETTRETRVMAVCERLMATRAGPEVEKL